MNYRLQIAQFSAFLLVATLQMGGCARKVDEPGLSNVPTAVDVRSALDGTIDRVSFADGTRVHAGQILFRIDPTPYRQESERRYIARTHALAQLEVANASRVRAERAASGKLDHATAERLARDIEDAKRELVAATAALNASKLTLEKTEIRAPIDGLASRALRRQGDLVASDSLLTTVTSATGSSGTADGAGLADANTRPKYQGATADLAH